jgi:hypothetical protein
MKSQATSQSQTNECGNYWFPINIICSNWNSQVQDGHNNAVMATTTTTTTIHDAETNYVPPFP